MKIISVFSPKGGVGKTSLTLSLAGAYAEQGLSVLVVDLDPQLSAHWVGSRGKLPFEVVAGMPKSKPAVDVVLFDHPPGVSEFPTAPIIVLPIRPSALDVHSASLLADQLNSEKQTIYRVVNAVDVRRKEEKQVAAELKKKGAFVVGNRSVYARATGEGVTIWQVGYSGHREARNEIKLLADAILKGDV